MPRKKRKMPKECVKSLEYRINYTANANNKYKSVIDGRGHVLKNVTIGSNGFINYCLAGTLKNIALVNVITPSKVDGLISSWGGAGAVVENVYISGNPVEAYKPYVITRIGGEITFRNVIYDVAGGALYEYVNTSFTSWTEAENPSDYVTEENVKQITDTFFTDNASLSFGSFAITDEGLTFNGNVVCMNNKYDVDLIDDSMSGTLGLVGAICEEENQQIELPYAIEGAENLTKISVLKSNTELVELPVSYQADNKFLVATSAIKELMSNNPDKATLKVYMEINDTVYLAQIQFLGVRNPLRIIDDVTDFDNFNTLSFDNTANGGTASDCYSYVFYKDIWYSGKAFDKTNDTFTNVYNGVIDGRGHILGQVTLSNSGLIINKFTGELKNLEITGVQYYSV